ncbi:MAG: alpha/beta fold hydrolase [Dehalococcoidia bacterium]
MNLGYIEADRMPTFVSDVDGFAIQGFVWEHPNPKGIVVIAHGAAEHSLRYGRFARALNAAGYEVWSLDHRGHGRSPGPEGLGDFGEGGWDALVADIGQFIGIAKAARPGLPVVLFGHSMGSAAGQQFAPSGSAMIDGLILSGSSSRMGRREGDSPAAFTPNAAFEPARTPYEWLSRDPDEVDKYIADPMCGFETQTSQRRGRASAARLTDPEVLKGIRRDLPCLLVAGTKDPVNRDMGGLYELQRLWNEAGVKRIDTLYYKDGRHEMLNETNRDEVTSDIIGWLNSVVR